MYVAIVTEGHGNCRNCDEPANLWKSNNHHSTVFSMVDMTPPCMTGNRSTEAVQHLVILITP